jgi:ribosomal protein L11 methyltransferase
MEAYLQPGMVTLDVGCGSGILSEVAHHLGASTVIACDIHPNAITTARQTCIHAAGFVGSVDAIESSVADFVLANISAKVIEVLAAELVRVTKPEGFLLLSGFIQDRTPEPFRPEKILERNGWLCWICRPELVSADASETGHAVQPFEAQWW